MDVSVAHGGDVVFCPVVVSGFVTPHHATQCATLSRS